MTKKHLQNEVRILGDQLHFSRRESERAWKRAEDLAGQVELLRAELEEVRTVAAPAGAVTFNFSAADFAKIGVSIEDKPRDLGSTAKRVKAALEEKDREIAKVQAELDALRQAVQPHGAGYFSFYNPNFEAIAKETREERELYRDAFVLTQHSFGFEPGDSLTFEDVKRLKKTHRKSGPPRIVYDDTTGVTKVLYPAPPTTPPHKQ